MTLNQLKKEASQVIKQRASNQALRSDYLGVTKTGIVKFKTTSGTTKGKFWYQQIKLLDLKKARELADEDGKVKNKDIVNLAIFGDIAVFCNDPSFKYFGWKYMSWQMGYGMRKENRFPKIRNPRLQGTVCKHLYSVFRVMPFYINEIVRDLKRKGAL